MSLVFRKGLDTAIPKDRENTFESKVVKKRQKDISGIEDKIISMYAKGMPTRQISKQINDIYGFGVSRKLAAYVILGISEEGRKFEATKRWTMPLRNRGKVYGELAIVYPDRLPI